MNEETARLTTAAGRPWILVGLNNPTTMPRLLEAAALLAREVGGVVQPFCVVKSAGSRDNAFAERLVAVARRCCGALSEAPELLLVEAPSLQRGVSEAISQTSPTHLLLGYSAHREDDRDSERAFAEVLRQTAKGYLGHMLVVNFGEPRDIRRLLAPVATDANLPALGQLVRALLREAEREVTLAHILPPEAGVAEHHAASAFLRQVAEACGLLGQVSFRVESNNDVAEGILEMAWDYDAVIVGMTRTRSLTERLLGGVSDQVAAWARCTTFLVRAARE